MIDLKLRPTPGAVPDARKALDALDDDVSAQTLDDLRLLVSELVTNSVRHAGLEQSQAIELKVTLLPETVRVEVNDPGSGFQPTPRTAQSDDQSGWGLYLVSRLADRWGVTSDGATRVWFELNRNRA
jgi:anti-sigma regulatory factor (Ser/Thr protein kinase)